MLRDITSRIGGIKDRIFVKRLLIACDDIQIFSVIEFTFLFTSREHN